MLGFVGPLSFEGGSFSFFDTDAMWLCLHQVLTSGHRFVYFGWSCRPIRAGGLNDIRVSGAQRLFQRRSADYNCVICYILLKPHVLFVIQQIIWDMLRLSPLTDISEISIQMWFRMKWARTVCFFERVLFVPVPCCSADPQFFPGHTFLNLLNNLRCNLFRTAFCVA